MQAVDRETIDSRGIPSDTLMEHAGAGIADRILSQLIEDPETVSAAVFCGKGNNGGDGYVIARLLHQAGVTVVIYFLGPLDALSVDAKRNFDRAAGLGIDLVEITSADILPEQLDCDLIVDAVFGTGFSGAPRGVSAEVIEYINDQDAHVVAVDMPSGMNADTGDFEGAVVVADYTYTLALPKFGQFVSPGRELVGEIEVVPIGIPEDVVESFNLTCSLTTMAEVIEALPIRPPDGHKGDFGKVLVIAGSTGLTGAASLAGESALRTGSGLVKVACPRTVQPVLAAKMTEVMTHPLPDVAKKGALALRALGELRELIAQHDAIVLGPGIGRHRETGELIRRLVASLDCPTIIDADGLNALAGHLDILQECPSALVLTPHPGEFERLTGEMPPDDIQKRADVVRKFADEHDVVLLLKGSPTLIAGPGSDCYLNPSGNNGMATGGSGDVLSGIIGSLLGQGMEALEAAVCGAYIHGTAGDIAAGEKTARAMIAGDMIHALPKVFELLD